MHDLITPGAVRRVLGIATVLILATGLAGCGPSARDMPVVVAAARDATVTVMFPVCEDDYIKSVKVHGAGEFARWDFTAPTVSEATRPQVAKVVFGADGIDIAAQFPDARLTSDVEQGPVSSGFFDLRSVDILTSDGEAYVRTEWLDDSSATQWILAKIPYKDGDVAVEPVSEAEGRARLLAWCEQ